MNVVEMQSFERSWASLPNASFAFEAGVMPTAYVSGVRLPRATHGRSYMGLGCWNSRGANLMTALRAMLGDEQAYAESAHFTVRRLQLRFAGDPESYFTALRRALYPSSGADWGGFHSFNPRSIDAAAEVRRLVDTSPASQRAQLRALAVLASTADAAAALLTRLLMDWKFQMASARQLTLRNLVRNRDNPEEQPEDSLVLWASVYPWVASAFYGPSTLVFEADEERRSADLPYVNKLLERGCRLGRRTCGRSGAGPLSGLGRLESGGLMANHDDGGPNSDLGQLTFPGYIRPERLAGFELRDADAATPSGAAPIELGFYSWRRSGRLDGTASPLVLVAVGDSIASGLPTCITYDAAAAAPALYACAPFAWNANRIPRLPTADESQPVSVAAVLFSAAASTGHAAQQAACEAARATLAAAAPAHDQAHLRPDDQPRPAGRSLAGNPEMSREGLARWPRVLAAINATRVGCTGHVLAVTSTEVSCEALLGEWRSRLESQAAAGHPDATLTVESRFGWAPHDWRGSVPAEWAVLSPAPACLPEASPPPVLSPPPLPPPPLPPPPVLSPPPLPPPPLPPPPRQPPTTPSPPLPASPPELVSPTTTGVDADADSVVDGLTVGLAVAFVGLGLHLRRAMCESGRLDGCLIRVRGAVAHRTAPGRLATREDVELAAATDTKEGWSGRLAALHDALPRRQEEHIHEHVSTVDI